MRRLLLAFPLLISAPASAQTQAANPVEPFSYGVRVGTAKNPLIAALSSVVPSAQAGSTQAASPVELFSYGRRVGTQSNPIYINLGNALDAYLPLTGGTVQNLTVSASFTVPSATYAQATASTCTVGQIYYISDGQRFWSAAAYGVGNSSAIYAATGAGQVGEFYGCILNGTASPTLVPMLMNSNGGAAK